MHTVGANHSCRAFVCSVVDLYIRSIYEPAIGTDICEAAAKVLCKVWLDQDDDVDEWKHIQQLDHSISVLDPDSISLKFYVLLEALENEAMHSLKQFCDVIQKWGIIQSSDSDDDLELVRSNEYGRWIECVEKVLQSGISFVKDVRELDLPTIIDTVGVWVLFLYFHALTLTFSPMTHSLAHSLAPTHPLLTHPPTHPLTYSFTHYPPFLI